MKKLGYVSQCSMGKCMPKIHFPTDQIYSHWLIHFVVWFNVIKMNVIWSSNKADHVQLLLSIWSKHLMLWFIIFGQSKCPFRKCSKKMVAWHSAAKIMHMHRTRTSSIIYRNYLKKMREKLDNRNNNFWIPLEKYEELGRDVKSVKSLK